MSKMTPDEIERAIEKNRRTLLRLVSCWLIMAFFMRRARNTLPKRISNWVSTLIVKAETATGYLIEASQMLGVAPMNNHCAFTSASKNHETGAVGDCANDCLKLDDIIDRLMAIKCALQGLAKHVDPQWVPAIEMQFKKSKNEWGGTAAVGASQVLPMHLAQYESQIAPP